MLSLRRCLDPPLNGVPDGDWFCPDCTNGLLRPACLLVDFFDTASESDQSDRDESYGSDDERKTAKRARKTAKPAKGRKQKKEPKPEREVLVGLFLC